MPGEPYKSGILTETLVSEAGPLDRTWSLRGVVAVPLVHLSGGRETNPPPTKTRRIFRNQSVVTGQ